MELARTHRVVENEDGVLALVGGKLTTYRAMAEEAVDRVVSQLRRVQDFASSVTACTTHQEPLLPAVERTPSSVPELSGSRYEAHDVIGELFLRRGIEAREMATAIDRNPELGKPLVQGLPYRWIEVERAIHFEGALHLDDVLRRRIPLALTDERLGAGVMHEVARQLIDARGGSSSDIRHEIERYQDVITQETRRTPR